ALSLLVAVGKINHQRNVVIRFLQRTLIVPSLRCTPVAHACIRVGEALSVLADTVSSSCMVGSMLPSPPIPPDTASSCSSVRAPSVFCARLGVLVGFFFFAIFAPPVLTRPTPRSQPDNVNF